MVRVFLFVSLVGFGVGGVLFCFVDVVVCLWSFVLFVCGGVVLGWCWLIFVSGGFVWGFWFCLFLPCHIPDNVGSLC